MRSRSEYQERDLFIDALRVLAVLIVVVGHWVTTTVIWEEGRISVENALSVIPESHVATWLLQVMPLLFFVGGFSNARSLSRHDGAYLTYLRTRLVRLLAPTLVFMSVWLLVGIVAEALPLREPNPLGRAADLAALPFWFLGMYVVVVALAPRLWQLHQRLGWWVPALFFAGAAIVDVLVYGFGYTAVGVANYAFVWLAVHQLGYAWRDGHMAGMRQGLTWVAGGLVVMVGLIMLGPYPVSMVNHRQGRVEELAGLRQRLRSTAAVLDGWLAGVYAALSHGVVLLIDYGYVLSEYYLDERSRGTLMCHYRHRAHGDPFLYPGLQDITAWVDFTAVAEAAVAAGLVLELPLYTGGAKDAELAKAWAEVRERRASIARQELELRQAVLDLWLEISSLRARLEELDSLGRYRDLYLDRSRALYELEVTADLGDAMVGTSDHRLQQARAEYDIALAWAHLDALTGRLLQAPNQTDPEQEETP